MTPTQVAARFAAFVWYRGVRKGPNALVREEARQFAKRNWKTFLPVADEGLGWLLIQIARRPRMSAPDQSLENKRKGHSLLAAG